MKKLSMAIFVVILAAVVTAQTPAPPAATPGAAAPPAGRGGGGFFRQPDPIAFDDHAGWTQIFDGTTFTGWDADFSLWRIENGAIVSESTCEKPTGTIYIVWQGGEAADFEIKFEMKGEGADVNGGLQYRGAIINPPTVRPTGGGGRGRGPQGPCPSGAPRGLPPSAASQAKWDMLGAQFDFDGKNRFTGQYYEQATGRAIIAWRGQVVRTEQGKTPRLLATLGDPSELAGFVKIEDWNQYHVIARGNTMTHIINGHVMSVLIDDDPTKFRRSGIIGFEIEGTGKIGMRNIWLKKL